MNLQSSLLQGAAHSPGDVAWLELLVALFEKTRRAGGTRGPADFLRSSEVAPRIGSLEAAQSRLLGIELIKVDLELRWKEAAGHGTLRGPLLEQYLKAFASLGPFDQLPLDLIQEEYRARRQWGDKPGKAEYAARFPRHGLALLDALADVECELAEDSPIDSDARDSLSAHAVVDPDAPLSLNDYALKRLIGAGGMCRVYSAVQKSLDKAVAVKILKPEHAADPRAVARFLHEAHVLAKLRRKEVVEVFGLGRLPGGGHFMALELIDGTDLARVGSRQSPHDAVEIVARLAETVEHIHRQGILHLDLKPSNVFLDSDGQPRLIDFGLSLEMALNSSDELPLARRAIAGTAAYMAPEQVDVAWGRLGPATDVHGLGGILYWMLGCLPPATGNTLEETLRRVASNDPVAPLTEIAPFLPRELVAICSRCLQKNPSHRYGGASELAAALRRWLN